MFLQDVGEPADLPVQLEVCEDLAVEVAFTLPYEGRLISPGPVQVPVYAVVRGVELSPFVEPDIRDRKIIVYGPIPLLEPVDALRLPCPETLEIFFRPFLECPIFVKVPYNCGPFEIIRRIENPLLYFPRQITTLYLISIFKLYMFSPGFHMEKINIRGFK